MNEYDSLHKSILYKAFEVFEERGYWLDAFLLRFQHIIERKSAFGNKGNWLEVGILYHRAKGGFDGSVWCLEIDALWLVRAHQFAEFVFVFLFGEHCAVFVENNTTRANAVCKWVARIDQSH